MTTTTAAMDGGFCHPSGRVCRRSVIVVHQNIRRFSGTVHIGGGNNIPVDILQFPRHRVCLPPPIRVQGDIIATALNFTPDVPIRFTVTDQVHAESSPTIASAAAATVTTTTWSSTTGGRHVLVWWSVFHAKLLPTD